MGVEIIKPDNVDTSKVTCVFGVLKTSEGLKIQDELMEWLAQNYNVYMVRQDPPGEQYEYPAIRYALDLCVENDLDYVLYIHTKGAVYTRTITTGTRLMWKDEFINKIDWYKNTCSTSNPVVATPFSSKRGTTWMNAFFINKAACKICDLKKNYKNRFYYEHIFVMPENSKISVVARILNDVDEPIHEQQHEKMNNYLINMTKINEKIEKKNVVYTCIVRTSKAL